MERLQQELRTDITGDTIINNSSQGSYTQKDKLDEQDQIMSIMFIQSKKYMN